MANNARRGAAGRTAFAALALVAFTIAASPRPAEDPTASFIATGFNPRPTPLTRPQAAPLSALAQLGRRLFFDPSLSSSGRRACASCHDPSHFYAPGNGLAVQFGGPDLTRQGTRAVPSLMYLERQPNFSIGPDDEETEGVDLAQAARDGAKTVKAQKSASDTSAAAVNLVPQGGLFWDGRADTLQQQADAPLFDPREMDAGSPQRVAQILRAAPYAGDFTQLFGAAIFKRPDFVVAEALSALARYEIEDPSFHPYSSKFDFWIEGKARLTPAEARGFLLFDDPDKGNCGGCHADKPSADGLAPLFTDHQFEALGAPRNRNLQTTRDPTYFDLGLCGPYRSDLVAQKDECGLFRTPSLRNVATRAGFFHNAVFPTLTSVVDFYVFRDVDPARVYPRDARGRVQKFDDLPQAAIANVDIVDAPLNRKLGDKPSLSPEEESDIVAFLRTLTDGWTPQTAADVAPVR